MSKELKINLEHPRFNDEFFGFKKIEEYLVNFKFLVDIMKKNNLVLLEEDELKKIGINKSEGLFSELYDDKYSTEITWILWDVINFFSNKTNDDTIIS